MPKGRQCRIFIKIKGDNAGFFIKIPKHQPCANLSGETFFKKVTFFEYIPRGVNIFENFKKLSSQI